MIYLYLDHSLLKIEIVNKLLSLRKSLKALINYVYQKSKYLYKKDGLEKLFTHKRYRIAIIVNRRRGQKSPGSSRPLKVNNYNNFKAFRKSHGVSKKLWIGEKTEELLINQLDHLNSINHMPT